MRLQQLGCAVTAGKETAQRESRAGMTRAFRSPKQTGASFVLGKVHADE